MTLMELVGWCNCPLRVFPQHFHRLHSCALAVVELSRCCVGSWLGYGRKGGRLGGAFSVVGQSRW